MFEQTPAHVHAPFSRNAAVKGQSIKCFSNSRASQGMCEGERPRVLADPIFAQHGEGALKVDFFKRERGKMICSGKRNLQEEEK